MTQYSLDVLNKSINYFDFCVYQSKPVTNAKNGFSLAWFAKAAHPGTKVRFTWDIDFSFVWDETGELKPGVTFDASQVVPADLADPATNTTQFTYEQDAYEFQPATGGELGSLTVMEAATLPSLEASVGIGMGGSGTFAAPAQPNLTLHFTPVVRYWIVAGTYKRGDVIDIETLTNSAEVVFPDNTYAMTALLDRENTWEIQSGTG